MVTTPHHLASQAGLDQLKSGGSAIEAIVAAAATISVVYPHMAGLGGDAFWLISVPGRSPIAIRAAGRTGRAVDRDLYRRHGLDAIPTRGPLAANTVAGVVDGWRLALAISEADGRVPDLGRLFSDAIGHAERGVFVTESQEQLTRDGHGELAGLPGFAATFLSQGRCPKMGQRLANPALARTFRRLAADGLDGFYRGPLAADIAADLARAGSPITAADLAEHAGATGAPLQIRLRDAVVFNHPPPTQGVASLMLLGLLDRLRPAEADGFSHVHAIVEATKLVFHDRDRHLADPGRMSIEAAALLAPAYLDELAARVDAARARPWPAAAAKGDTVWLGAIDGRGVAVSYIQSNYYDFGSGIVLPETGILWQNRGIAFELHGDGPRALAPRTLPFHTLNPALAAFDDDRTMVFGAMGGDGQPQTHAALFSRYATFGQPLQQAITAPRWLLGRRWASAGASLRVESRLDQAVIARLREAGHDVEVIEPFSDLMGHAGAIVRHPDGALEGAADPRSDGMVAAW
jgi:gamma-glutamyltranspeptidase/glutathione hydrolase